MQVKGYNGKVEVRGNGVAIVRGGLSAVANKAEVFLRFGQIEALELKEPTWATNGIFRVVPRGWGKDKGWAAIDNHIWEVQFRRPKREEFKELRRALETAVAAAEPEMEPVPRPRDALDAKQTEFFLPTRI